MRLQRDVFTRFSHSLYEPPWVHVSSQISILSVFHIKRQTDCDCTDVGTIKIQLIAGSLH